MESNQNTNQQQQWSKEQDDRIIVFPPPIGAGLQAKFRTNTAESDTNSERLQNATSAAGIYRAVALLIGLGAGITGLVAVLSDSSSPSVVGQPESNNDWKALFVLKITVIFIWLSVAATVLLLVRSFVQKHVPDNREFMITSYGYHVIFGIVLFALGVLLMIFALSDGECASHFNISNCKQHILVVCTATFTMILGVFYTLISFSMLPCRGDNVSSDVAYGTSTNNVYNRTFVRGNQGDSGYSRFK